MSGANLGGVSSMNADSRRRGRKSSAMVLAFAAGIPAGLFAKACAVPFGPVLLGLLVVLGGAIVVSAMLCVLATDHYGLVGFAYAAGVALAVVIANIATDGIFPLSAPLGQFAVIFAIVGSISLLGSLPCALLKWEHRRARERNQNEP